jgi:restriction system protein
MSREFTMPEITRRRTGELLRKLFEILIPQPDGMQARDALEELKNRVPLTEYERGQYESGGPRFNRIVRLATIDCVKAGWMLKQKGKWFVTDEGKDVYAKYADPEAFYRRAVKLYQAWKANQPTPVDGGTEGQSDNGGAKEASITFEQAEEQAWQEIEQFLRGMNPYEFQELVASLLRAMSYHVSWISPPGKDGGIDILAYSDPLGTRTPRIKVQVKRVEQSIRVDDLRSFMALLGDDDVGLFVTTSAFTKDAQTEARTQEKRKITLIDLERLFDLWTEYYSQLDDASRRRFPLRPIYFLAPEGK